MLEKSKWAVAMVRLPIQMLTVGGLRSNIGSVSARPFSSRKPGQEEVDVGRADVEGGRVVVVEVRFDAPQELGQRHALGLEIEARHVVIVEEAAADLRRASVADHRPAAVERSEIFDGGGGRLRSRGARSPNPCDPFEDCRLLRFEELGKGNPLRIESVDLPNLARDLRHRHRELAS